MEPKIHQEIVNCRHGEKNPITEEIFCYRYNAFCKHVGECAIRRQT